MSMSKFPIFQTRVPRVGREGIFNRLIGDLTNPTPSHISLVGPRYSGKTVLLHAIADELRPQGGKYQAVIYWDLGHRTPRTDVEFLTMLRKHVANGIKVENPNEAAYLDEKEAGYDELHEVIGALSADGKRLLMIWDGFDRPLHEGSLTRNLWDNLLDLCRMSAFRVVTASRRRLRELIRDAESVTSDFWGVFDSHSLLAMDADDVEAFAAAMPERSFGAGALKEVMNWSGGIPPLVAWLMNRFAQHHGAGITNTQVTTVAGDPDEQCTGILEQIWSDCPAPAKDLFRTLAEAGPRTTADIPQPERLALRDFCLGADAGGLFHAKCKMLVKHVGGEIPEFGALARLFGTREEYSKNIRGILERRFSHITRFDEPLFHMVERAIEDIPNHTDSSLASLSQIEDRAFDLIWQWECDGEGVLPTKVISDWTNMPERQQRSPVSEMIAADDGHPHAWRVPSERSKQLAILQFLTGSHQTYSRSHARRVGKDAYVLLNAIHSFRNRSQHAGGQKIPLGVAISALMICVEMLACLESGSG